MTIHITFTNGSNPYIRFNMDKKQFRNELRKWKRNYNIVHKYQNGTIFNITLEEKPLTEIYKRQFKERLYYQRMKRRARNTAIYWQEKFSEKSMSYEELVNFMGMDGILVDSASNSDGSEEKEYVWHLYDDNYEKCKVTAHFFKGKLSGISID